jgi:hypothetical protein
MTPTIRGKGVTMREVRCVIFEEREVFAAVVGSRRARNQAMPPGLVDRITLSEDEIVHATFYITADDGRKITLSIGETELAAALIRYLLERNVPVPQKLRKMLIVTEHQLGLVFYDSAIPFRRGKPLGEMMSDGA